MTEIASRLFGPWVRTLDRPTLRADAIAGLLGALLVLPQGFAFATLAGLPPEYGLATAIVPCAIAALFGSSLHVVSGPTNMISLVLFATVAPFAVVGSRNYIELVLGVTLVVGMMQWLIGALRLGGLANFISPAALRGFTGGAAALIVVHSLPNLLGLPGGEHRAAVLLASIVASIGSASVPTVVVSAFTIATALLLRRAWPRSPHLLLALVAATALATAINRWWPGLPAGGSAVATLGAVPPVWPRFQWPAFDPARLPDLVGIAFALTIVSLAQSISIAKAVAERSGQRIDPNREFRGQGLANMVGAFFSSYVACGSLNRSMPNYEAGARTPLAAVFAAVWLLLLVALMAPLLGLLPLAAIAGLLLLIAWSLFDLAGWRELWRFSRRDVAIAAATFVATVTIRLEIAILLGTILSLLGYLYRTSKPSLKVMGFDTDAPGRPFVVRADVAAPLGECPQLKMVRMEGEVYFGAVAHVEEQLHDLRAPLAAPKHLLVMSKSMNFIDLAAAEMWKKELHSRRTIGGDLYFHRPRAPVLELWQRIGFLAELGADHVFPAKRIAIATIFDRLDRGICAHCTVRVFEECKTLPPPVAPIA